MARAVATGAAVMAILPGTAPHRKASPREKARPKAKAATKVGAKAKAEKHREARVALFAVIATSQGTHRTSVSPFTQSCDASPRLTTLKKKQPKQKK